MLTKRHHIIVCLQIFVGVDADPVTLVPFSITDQNCYNLPIYCNVRNSMSIQILIILHFSISESYFVKMHTSGGTVRSSDLIVNVAVVGNDLLLHTNSSTREKILHVFIYYC